MFNQFFNADDSFIELKNRIAIIQLKKTIKDSSLDDDFKKEINNYLFKNDDEFNNELVSEFLHLADFQIIIKDTIDDFEGHSQDISFFKNEIKMKIRNFYKNIEKPILFSNLEQLPRKNGVYYITPYIVFNNRTGDSLSVISQEIYEYKEYKRYIDYFTKEIMKAISFLSNKKINEDISNIALVCLPRSTVDFESTIQQSIDIISSWHGYGITDFEYGCSKNIINCRGLLTRFETIPQSSTGAYLTEDDHLNSIKCKIDSKLDLKDTAFILLDDITTHGTIMRACMRLLMNENVNFKNIYMLAIGGTRGY